jgi:hypothetical protein
MERDRQQPQPPTEWERIRNGIFAGESGGDYNAVFGYANRPGGKFADRPLTSMTVDDALTFAAPSGEYGQWVKGQIGRVATPMGAYQVVGTTLRAAKEGLGLRGDEVMTPILQDKIGQWIYAQQGTGAWEGYKGPRDSYDPALGGVAYASNGAAGPQGGQTSAQGQPSQEPPAPSQDNALRAPQLAMMDPAQFMTAPNALALQPISGQRTNYLSGRS